MNTPLVTVVIPHFNRADLLVETLASLRAQTFPNWEAVVVDDGSDADQWAAIQQMRDDRIQVVARDRQPKGPSACRNIGVGLSRGTHIVFLDSDDLMAPWCLTNRMRAVAENPEEGFWIFPVLLFQHQMGDSDVCWNDFRTGPDLMRFLQADPPWHTSSPIWRRTSLDELGGFNEAVMYGDDTDLHIRALLRKIPYAKMDFALPDLFVRRDASPRITNSLSESMLQSRRVRLLEGSKALSDADRRSVETWEGQYFVECEFLLFNTSTPAANIQAVVSDWRASHHPKWAQRFVVQAYLAFAVATRDRAYILLRIARRIAMKVLPKSYFPDGGSFQNTTLSKEMIEQVRVQLSNAVRVPK
ncbi:GalNAc(5)-diNAcBac-PP-undecaprenol beta-1,3-glucosyltransferase [Rosistilla carotiformis]|uniref:GalNAc(5)-diNAcBac-PP-undecaprenol beta-1,3-glucosyltransferase n=1 Tax=Rosistilla carotiformis TaxID=2528017 RepID=A0A518JVH2_9BACT|nr:glycosyltransferase family A protein [Rosistilla carotiformis]QDV69526.1 GalNAc(5)-diNAcBac-PP-undecaprenol beta-1,3-glucosyltransferase [Rosistilla carotiformis]